MQRERNNAKILTLIQKLRRVKMGEINIISEGIAILILTIIQEALIGLGTACDGAEFLKEKTKRTLLLYMVGLVGIEKQASCYKIHETIGKISHDKFTRALKGENILIGKLALIFLNFCLIQTSSGTLIIDDFLIPKEFSNKIEGVYYEFDHTTRQRIKGMRVVLILWTDGQIRIPIAWSIWHKEDKRLIGYSAKGRPRYEHTGQCLLHINGQIIPYRTKNQISMSLLTDVLEKRIDPQYITFDMWYANIINLKKIHWLHLLFYSRIKDNRNVIYLGEKLNLRTLALRFPITSFDHKHGAFIKAIEVMLPSFGNIKLLMVRRDTHDESGETKFIFTNNLNASAGEILLCYRTRWAIETVFRDLKQNLNVTSCQARTLCAQQNHFALSLLTFVALEIQNLYSFDYCQLSSIGEKKLFLNSVSTLRSGREFFVMENKKMHSKICKIELSPLYKVKDSMNLALDTLYF